MASLISTVILLDHGVFIQPPTTAAALYTLLRLDGPLTVAPSTVDTSAQITSATVSLWMTAVGMFTVIWAIIITLKSSLPQPAATRPQLMVPCYMPPPPALINAGRMTFPKSRIFGHRMVGVVHLIWLIRQSNLAVRLLITTPYQVSYIHHIYTTHPHGIKIRSSLVSTIDIPSPYETHYYYMNTSLPSHKCNLPSQKQSPPSHKQYLSMLPSYTRHNDPRSWHTKHRQLSYCRPCLCLWPHSCQYPCGYTYNSSSSSEYPHSNCFIHWCHGRSIHQRCLHYQCTRISLSWYSSQ